MTVDEIRFRDFRNIENETLHFDRGVNILWGDNAQGKTNALEGIFCFAMGKSFRGVRDRELIRFGCEQAGMTMHYADGERTHKMQLQLSAAGRRRMLKNDVTVRSTAQFVGSFRGVLFCPEHLQMIKGAPQLRRQFLDAAICQLRPTYMTALSEYARLLKHRNAVLRDDAKTEEERLPLLDVLTAQLAQINTRITVTRQKYIRLLDASVGTFLSDMTSGEELASLSYVSDIADGDSGMDAAEMTETFYRRAMADTRREFAVQSTLHGCHRDDIAIWLDGREAKLYASQGQDRSIALAMKLGEGELSRQASGEYPVFLFDDVLSELDHSRQAYLMQRLHGRQVIMTSCNRELFEDMDVHMIRVTRGSYDMCRAASGAICTDPVS
ncbi:MAG: DNA replication/repair protein RecF [Clostridia bacterium]|nr:DNA replication/repair protein RecF [Clostridia bacterium]